MKILLVTHHWKPYTHHSSSSGYQRLAYYLANQHEVNLLTWKKWGDDIADETGGNLRVIRVTTPASDLFLERRLILSWRAQQKAKHYNLVHALYSIPAFFPARAGLTVATVHIIPEVDPTQPWLLYKGLLQRLVLKKVARIITVSTNLQAILADRYGWGRVTYIPHGIDVHAFKPGVLDASAVRHALLADRYQALALMVGFHGMERRLIRHLASQQRDVLLVIVGKPFSTSGLQNIKFLGKLSEEEMIRVYESADVFFRPLRFATANNAILEAMAMGKPIVTHRIAGVTDYLDTDSAYLAQDDEDFVVQFRRALENQEERQQKGKNARLKAEQEFSWERIANRISAVYSEVCS